MARIGGRNSFMAWVVGLGCAAVVTGLVALAVPAIPTGIQLIGDTLRGGASAPQAAAERVSVERETTTPECRALYTEALWAQLTQRVGGDPVQDLTPPVTVASGLATALAPAVRVTCAFTAPNAGAIVTSVSDVAGDAADVAEATLLAAGFDCIGFGDGIRCTASTDAGVEEQIVRDGVWVATTYQGWRPDHYVERMAQQVWPG